MAHEAEHTHQTEEDMVSKLNDDLLVSILGNVNLTTAMRASVVSKRWKHLPWLLTQLRINIEDFLHEPYADPTVDGHIDKAMSSLTEAVKTMLAPTRKSIIRRLCISLFLTNSYSDEIGRLVSEAIENGVVKDLNITSGLESIASDISDEEMVKHADSVNCFFHNYPNIYFCLRSLSLFNATFSEYDMHNLIANTWTQLHSLRLFQCGTGFNTSVKIDAPNSKLNTLEITYCSCKQVELVCLPKLEILIYGYWISPYLPLTLGNVPCLKEAEIFSSMESYQSPFKLSELLCSTTCINTLALDFQGQKIWLQPEKNQLHSAFSNLRALSLQGIFVEFGLLWTITLLEAAPYLETLHVEVCDHICIREEERNELYGERTNAPWDGCVDFSKCLPLKELRLDGFSANEDHITFIGAVMERASNLQSVILQEQYCKKCIAICISTTKSKCKFPKKGDEQEMVANSLRSRFSSCAQIIFNDYKLSSD